MPRSFRLPKGVVVADLKTKLVSRRGRTSKARGASFEKHVSEAIATWIELGVDDVARARGGRGAIDVRLSSEARKRYPFWTECKNHKTLSLPAWIRQAEAASAGSGLTPIIVYRIWSGKPGEAAKEYVTIEFTEFMKLVTSKGKD